MNKPISPTAHAAMDYALGATLLGAPTIMGMSPRAKMFFGAFGLLATVVTAMTNTRLAVRRVIPLQTHRMLDLATDPLYLAVPVVTGIAREPRARALWLATSAALVAGVALTDWKPDVPAGS